MSRLGKRIAGALGVWHALLWLESILGRRHQILVVTYHHISDPATQEPALSGLQTGTSRSVFEEQMRALCRWYRPIDVAAFTEIALGRAPLRHDSFLVTFDDAYESVRTNAAPGMRRHGIRGHVFVATGYIETARRFWWVRVVDWMRQITPAAWNALAASTESLPPAMQALFAQMRIDEPAERRRASQAILAILDASDDAIKEQVLDELELHCRHAGVTGLPLMTWDQLRAMAKDGCTIGGHSHSHLRMGRASRQRVRDDLLESNRVFLAELSTRPGSFAYPSGDFNESTGQLVAEAGYQIAFTTRDGFLAGEAPDPMRIPRTSLGNRTGTGLAARVALFKLQKHVGSLRRWRGPRR